jgi:hypothetical protein
VRASPAAAYEHRVPARPAVASSLRVARTGSESYQPHAPLRGLTIVLLQSSSSSSAARRRPICESTAILPASPFRDPVASIYLPLRETTTFDHPSDCNFSRTCSAVTGRSAAMKAGAEDCCANVQYPPFYLAAPPATAAPADQGFTHCVFCRGSSLGFT